MISDPILVRRLRDEAASDHTAAPAFLDDAVMRLVRATPQEGASPRRNLLTFPVALATGLAACLAVAATVGGLRLKERYDNMHEMQALAADVADAANFIAQAVKPITHGIRS